MEIVPYFLLKNDGSKVVIGEARVSRVVSEEHAGFVGIANYFHEALNEAMGTTYTHNFFGDISFISSAEHLDQVFATEEFVRSVIEHYKE